MSPKGEGKSKLNNADIVYGFLVKLSRPIVFNRPYLIQLLKKHRDLALTDSQLRTIFDKLTLELKISVSKQGNMSKVSILSDYEEMVFSQPMEHLFGGTPQKAWAIQKYLKTHCIGYQNRISMYELARRFKSPTQSQSGAERELRDIVHFTNNDKYIQENGFPFDRVISSSSAGHNKGGYYLSSNEHEIGTTIERSRAKAMRYWRDHWAIVRKATKQNQYRIKGSDTQLAVFKAISDDLKANPLKVYEIEKENKEYE